MSPPSALDQWGEALREWAIPEEILAQAPESPYGFPTEIFATASEEQIGRAPNPSGRRALEALPEGGTVLDIGVGAGASSLPLSVRASIIVGVDPSEELLAEFRRIAKTAGVPVRAVMGGWPDAAADVGSEDVAVCHHILYNVQDLGPFVAALSEKAKRRVVIEITDRHPLSWMNPLWVRFHGLERPVRPTADDAERALRELGVDVLREDHRPESEQGWFARKEDAVAHVRRRLCLPPERDPEVEETLGDQLILRDSSWTVAREITLVTFWWDTA